MGGGPLFRSVLYYTNWSIYSRNHHPQSLPTTHLTHILYAFANIRPETGEVYLTDPWSDTDKHYPSDSWNDIGTNVYGCVKQLFLLKKRERRVKVLLSIGGWSYSGNFAGVAGDPERRKRFAESAVGLLEDLGLDGLDVDWEYRKDAREATDFVCLLRVMREALSRAEVKRREKTRFLLTVACPAGPRNFEKLKVKEMDQCLDFWNLMAYDYSGSWDATAGHQANLWPSMENSATTPFSTSAALKYYIDECGVDPAKMVLGMPLYGRSFVGTDGPGHSYSEVGEGSWERGVWDFKALPKEDAVECYDEKVGASWSYDQHKRIMATYDTVEMAGAKSSFVKESGLGGGMWWESSGDKAFGQGSLVEAFVAGIGGSGRLEGSQNCLDYPESKYDNLRKGFPGEI